jgi:hypothetical protein
MAEDVPGQPQRSVVVMRAAVHLDGHVERLQIANAVEPGEQPDRPQPERSREERALGNLADRREDDPIERRVEAEVVEDAVERQPGCVILARRPEDLDPAGGGFERVGQLAVVANEAEPQQALGGLDERTRHQLPERR